jgi:hypothetical protein
MGNVQGAFIWIITHDFTTGIHLTIFIYLEHMFWNLLETGVGINSKHYSEQKLIFLSTLQIIDY